MNSVSPECLPRSCTYRGKRKRRALDNQDSPLFGYATSSEVLYAPKNNCQSVTCPTNSTCVELFPPVCRCSDHSFYFQDVCIPYTNDFMFRLKHLHFDVPWMEKYHDEQSLEFQYLKRRTEERLFHLLSQVLNTPSLLSVKVEPTGKNQVVVSEGHWLIDQLVLKWEYLGRDYWKHDINRYFNEKIDMSTLPSQIVGGGSIFFLPLQFIRTPQSTEILKIFYPSKLLPPPNLTKSR